MTIELSKKITLDIGSKSVKNAIKSKSTLITENEGNIATFLQNSS